MYESEPLLSIAYASYASLRLDEAQLEEILVVSRTRNAENGLTGVLLYDGGYFFQVLEGPAAVVTERYERIANDHRHFHVRKLYEESIPERRFGDWSMWYEKLETLSLDLQDTARAFLIALATVGHEERAADLVPHFLDRFHEGMLEASA